MGGGAFGGDLFGGMGGGLDSTFGGFGAPTQQFGGRGQHKSNQLNTKKFKQFSHGARPNSNISSNYLDQVAEQGAKKAIIKKIRKEAFGDPENQFGGN